MKKKHRKDRAKEAAPSAEAEVRGTILRPLLPVVCMAVLVCGAVWGLERLRAHVFALPEYRQPIRVELQNPPDWLERERWGPRILAGIKIPADASLPDATLVKQIAQDLAGSGWVKHVHAVRKRMDGAVLVDCEYRRPIAMLQTEYCYVPVDREGVRLPEVYERVDNSSGWLRIVGVKTEIPQVNGRFVGEDANAAIEIASGIFDQGWEISSRLCAVDVNNFRGRVDRRKDYILVWRPDHPHPIIWGSAIGEEIEEPTAAEKLATIAVMLKQGGPQAQANVSVFPGAAIYPVAPSVETADSSTRRDR